MVMWSDEHPALPGLRQGEAFQNDKKIENIRKNYGNQYQGTSFQSHLCVSVEKLEEILGKNADGYHEVLVNYLTGEIVSYEVDEIGDDVLREAELPEKGGK